MRRWIVALAAGSLAAAAVGGSAGAVAGHHPGGGEHRGYFAVLCGFSHRNADDPIVYPNRPGRSHNHTYFGNTTTKAASTPASLRAAGTTTCRLRADTAAYWAPTLYVRNAAVAPRGALVFYVRRTRDPVQAFPAGLKVIAGDATARAAQSTRVTFWTCGRRDVAVSSAIPTCAEPSLRLVVNFPSCWDGRRLDSSDHKSHMAYATDGVCPATHPVEVPGIQLQIFYGIPGGPQAELASGGDFSGHADFINAWHQGTLERLVDRYLNRVGRGRG